MKRVAIVAILAGILGSSAGGRAQSAAVASTDLTAAETAAIDRIGRSSVAGAATPGVIIAVVRGGSIVYAKGFGYRNVEDAVSVAPDTRFPIGSNTKQFTAAAILMLQDEGKLNIDDRLAKYLPQIPHAREVRLRNLLNHSGGYAEFTAIETFDELGNRPTTLAHNVGTVDARPLAFRPGTKREYSNTGYQLLSMVIERSSGMPYKDFLQRRIFVPLGMTSTYVRDSDDTQLNVATEYQSFALGPWEHAEHIDYTWFVGAGAIISNVQDLAKWNAALDGGKLLSKRSQTEMMTPVKIGAAFPDYGFAIMTSKLPNGHRMVFHGGNTTGAASQDARFPDDNLAIMVLSNSGAFDYTSAVSALYAVLVPAPHSSAASPSPQPGASATPVSGAKPLVTAAAERWLDQAVAGHIDLTRMRADARARLQPTHRAALTALSALGPRTYKLINVDRRPPATGYEFLLSTPKKKLIYAYSQDDDGMVAGADVIELVDYTPHGEPSPAPIASPQPVGVPAKP